MSSTIIKQQYENWWNSLGLKDAPASQIIEMRRAFYSGFFACMSVPNSVDTNGQEIFKELAEFFEMEVETGFGIPSTDTLCECGHPLGLHHELDRKTLPPEYRGPFWVCGPAGPDACLCGKFRPVKPTDGKAAS